MSSQQSINEILEQLKNLDQSNEFYYFNFLKNTSYLCKTKSSLLLSYEEDKEYKIVESFCEDNYSQEQLYEDAREALNRIQNRPYTYEKINSETDLYIAVIKIDFDKTDTKFLVLTLNASDKQILSDLILRAILCTNILIPKNQDLAFNTISFPNTLENLHNHFKTIIEIFNEVIQEDTFDLMLMKLTNSLCVNFNSHKVSLGLLDKEYIKLKVVSHVESFEKDSSMTKAIEAVFEEAYFQNEDILSIHNKQNIITNAHEKYSLENKLENIYTFLIKHDQQVLGVVSFEHRNQLDESNLTAIRILLNYLSLYLYKNSIESKPVIKRVFIKAQLKWKNFLLKNRYSKLFIVFTILLFFMWIFFGKMEYKVDAVVNIQTKNIQYITAPYDGLVKSVNKDIGENILENEFLIQFNTDELELNKIEIEADLIKYNAEIKKAQSQRELADMQISNSKIQQTQANLEKVNYYINQAKVKSDISGIIVEGNKEKLVGTPFVKGDLLMKIASLNDMYANIKVLEEYIDEIKLDQKVEITLLTKPNETIDALITKVIPMANVDDQNGNIFILNASFNEEQKIWIRPGMTGIAKITIEDRTVFWILTHKVSDFLHFNLWW